MNIQKIMSSLEAKHPGESEYLQAVKEVLLSIEDIYNQHPEFEKAKIIERLVEPDRIFTFRVTWVDDRGEVQTNLGYRVQFNNAIGPYKGGIRFHASVNLSILKFLGFEQTFKNALTTLPMGGGKGGSDFSPRGKSDAEIMRFCQAFMLELWRHLGPDMDVPAGDMYPNATFVEGKRPWEVKADIALPCATQNELNGEDAQNLIKNDVLCVGEISNMGCTPEAIDLFIEHKTMYAPGKAVNAGGVATSGLEMSQNAMHLSWSAAEVDEKLHAIMHGIHAQCVKYGTEPDGYINYVKGANIAGFMKVAHAMMGQGVI